MVLGSDRRRCAVSDDDDDVHHSCLFESFGKLENVDREILGLGKWYCRFCGERCRAAHCGGGLNPDWS